MLTGTGIGTQRRRTADRMPVAGRRHSLPRLVPHSLVADCRRRAVHTNVSSFILLFSSQDQLIVIDAERLLRLTQLAGLWQNLPVYPPLAQ